MKKASKRNHICLNYSGQRHEASNGFINECKVHQCILRCNEVAYFNYKTSKKDKDINHKMETLLFHQCILLCNY